MIHWIFRYNMIFNKAFESNLQNIYIYKTT